MLSELGETYPIAKGVGRGLEVSPFRSGLVADRFSEGHWPHGFLVPAPHKEILLMNMRHIPVAVAVVSALCACWTLAEQPSYRRRSGDGGSNILANGSFEVGMHSWACFVRGTPYTESIKIRGLDPQAEVVRDRNAPHGN